MKRNIALLLLVAVLTICVTSCGSMEKIYDEQNYESLTNEKGDIYFVSAGDTLSIYKDAKVIYSSSDMQAMWIKCKGKRHYLQGDVIIDLK